MWAALRRRRLLGKLGRSRCAGVHIPSACPHLQYDAAHPYDSPRQVRRRQRRRANDRGGGEAARGVGMSRMESSVATQAAPRAWRSWPYNWPAQPTGTAHLEGIAGADRRMPAVLAACFTAARSSGSSGRWRPGLGACRPGSQAQLLRQLEAGSFLYSAGGTQSPPPAAGNALRPCGRYLCSRPAAGCQPTSGSSAAARQRGAALRQPGAPVIRACSSDALPCCRGRGAAASRCGTCCRTPLPAAAPLFRQQSEHTLRTLPAPRPAPARPARAWQAALQPGCCCRTPARGPGAAGSAGRSPSGLMAQHC
jgi:hypothetical protein